MSRVRGTFDLSVVYLTTDAMASVSPASAASDLFGLVDTGGFTAFGSIDPATGAFTQLSTTGLPDEAYYAPVYNPAQNAFFVTDQPINSARLVDVLPLH